MSRHSQKVAKKHMQCRPCSEGNCHHCVDVYRAIYDRAGICSCSRDTHGGEPRDQQILDPESGSVYAPGLVVKQDGQVEYTTSISSHRSWCNGGHGESDCPEPEDE